MMTGRLSGSAATLVREAARVVASSADYDALVDMAGQAQLVLIGEASHGTHEFYATRAELTRRLIAEKGFQGVAVEADWPDSFRVHRFVTGRSDDSSAAVALSDFQRFPGWMWRNLEVAGFCDWLRDWNARHRGGCGPAGFYGLDLYSLHRSISAVLDYLTQVDPQAAQLARRRYSCFDHFGEDPQLYGYATVAGGAQSCESEVVAELLDLRRKQDQLMRRDGRIAEEEFFSAEQNARLVMNSERYYRAMFSGRASSWNLRDSHMFETFDALMDHLGRGSAKMVVWAHNSHLGDARATAMSDRGELNLGQLVREKWAAGAFLIGFSTHSGTVTAASDWGATAERKQVRPALAESYEALFHDCGLAGFWLDLRQQNQAHALLARQRLERAIGVIYRPETERLSHYFRARLTGQFDVIIHLDETRALEPLERTSLWEQGEFPETYPSAL